MDEHVTHLQGQYQARVRWGTQASGSAFDRKKLSFLNPEAQEFLAQQTLCVIAGGNGQGTIAGHIVLGLPGFARSSDPSVCLLELDEKSVQSDLLVHLQECTLAGDNASVALFFINHATRQRLCVHGRAEVLSTCFFAPQWMRRFQRPRRLRLHVEQAFFHCPRYIRTMVAGLTAPAVVKFEREQVLGEFRAGARKALSAPLGDFLRHQTSCFLCTISHQGTCAINHRGGAPGFLLMLPPDEEAAGGRLLLPDYKGNGAFEALGNILETGMVTLIVPDYSLQVALIISGLACVLEPDELSSDVRAKYIGAERVVSLAVRYVALQSGDWTLPLAYERAAAHIVKRQQRKMLCPLGG